MTSTMKIISLQAENIKKLTAVNISPSGDLVQITGKNGQGKTSVLDAIWWCLAGKGAVQSTPITKGKERAIIRLDLGEIIVTRNFTSKDDGDFTTTISVENADGARFQKPQEMLDALLGHLSFDPLAFSRMKPADQINALRSLVEFDWSAHDAAQKKDFEERTFLNRQAKLARATAESLSARIPDNIPEVEDQEALHIEYREACAKNDAFKDHNIAVGQAERNLESAEAELERKREKRRQLMESLESVNEGIDFASKGIEGLKSAAFELAKVRVSQVDVGAIEQRMAKAKELSGIKALIDERDAALIEEKEKRAQSDRLTDARAAREEAAGKAIASADINLNGLDVDGDAVLLDGIPFDQASDAQQLTASISVAMALNPTLRVIRVRDGSLLDEDALKLLEKMATDQDYQIWIERVDSSGKVGFVLEDGHIKGAETPDSIIPKKKAKVDPKKETVKVPVQNVHMTHCNQGDYEGSCKYGEAGCPALIPSDKLL